MNYTGFSELMKISHIHWGTISFLIGTTQLMLFLSFYLWARYKQTYWARRGIYSPPAHWLFGHVIDTVTKKFAISKCFADICQNPANQHVPVIGVYVFHQPLLLLRDPDLISRALLTDFRFFPNRRFCMRSQNVVIDNTNLYAINHPQWTCLREKFTPAFDENRIQGMFHLILEGAEHLRCHLEKTVPPNQHAELYVFSLSRRFIVDVMTSIIFGVSTNSFEEPDSEIYKHACGLYTTSKSRTWFKYVNVLFPQLVNSMFGTSITNHVDFFRNLFWKSLQEREESGMSRGDFMDLLLDLKKSVQNPFILESDWLFGQAMVLVAAGLDTSAIAMSLSLFEIARNPKIQKKVRQEIHDKIGHKPISFKLVSRMSYLESVVLETMRLYPPTSFVNRMAQKDYKIPNSNIVIEKGTAVYVSLRGLHHNPLFHPNPLKYDPDRFSKENYPKIKQCTFLPFGDGPRRCIGNRIALTQTMIGLIVVLRNYNISIKMGDTGRNYTTIDECCRMSLEKSSVNEELEKS